MARARILIVDDEAHLLEALGELLRGDGYDVTQAASAEEAIERCRHDTFHLVLTDLELPGRNGLFLIKTLKEACPATVTVLITGHGTIRSAVLALQRGAAEYVVKPVKPARLLALVRALTAEGRIASFLPNRLLADERAETVRFDGLVARSAAMRCVVEQTRAAAASASPVLVVGESGTGKQLVAESLHRRSPRANGPLITFHAGSVSADRATADLFGDESVPASSRAPLPGRVEQADGGTLILDDVARLDDHTQGLVVRLLETGRYVRVGGRRERSVDVRLVATSPHDLGALARAGRLREDLYFRLAGVTITLPSLRERAEDVPPIAHELLAELAARYGKRVASIAPEAERLLVGHPWPGNVRELRSVVEQAVLLARPDATQLDAELLPQLLHVAGPRADHLRISIGTPMEEVERAVILRTLAANDGNKTVTAEVLGISRRSIYNKLAEYGEPAVAAAGGVPTDDAVGPDGPH